MNIKTIAINIVAFGAVFVIGILLFNFVLMPMLVHQRGSVIVPDLRSMSEAQAVKTVENVGLNLRVERTEYHATVPEGYVVSQQPRPNENIKEGRTVAVVVSMGAKTARVPDLKGMSLRQARLVLSRAQLSVGRVARVHTEGDAREQVLACAPHVGDELVEGSPVNMVVAVGGQKHRFVMPDLVGQDLLFIRDKLTDMGFRVSGVRYEDREGVFPNTVIGQSPDPGALIREGDSIELVAASAD